MHTCCKQQRFYGVILLYRENTKTIYTLCINVHVMWRAKTKVMDYSAFYVRVKNERTTFTVLYVQQNSNFSGKKYEYKIMMFSFCVKVT